MNFNVSHIRLTDRMISDLKEIVEFDKKICKIRSIPYDDLYGNLSVTGYIAEVLNRELVRQDAVLTFYGVYSDNISLSEQSSGSVREAEHERSE